MFEDRCATPAEAVQEFARNAGEDRPDKEWFLHDYDVWVRNPHFRGTPGPRPDADEDEFTAWEFAQEPLGKLAANFNSIIGRLLADRHRAELLADPDDLPF